MFLYQYYYEVNKLILLKLFDCQAIIILQVWLVIYDVEVSLQQVL